MPRGQYRIRLLDEVRMHPALVQIRSGRRGKKSSSNYKRWSIVMEMLEGTSDLLDIGIGRGEFASAAVLAGIKRVRGADYKPHSKLRNETGFEVVPYDLTTPPPNELRSAVVTCMECIEHIPDAAFDLAVQHLKSLATERLIVTVPFMEEEPLPRMHYQRFTGQRLRSLFPRGKITLMAQQSSIRWALVDWRPNQ